MKNTFRLSIILSASVLANQAHAQFTGNNQTNLISGVTNNWPGDYYVGSNYVFDALLIQNGGALSNYNGYIGYNVGANSNLVLISGSGSIWNNSTNLIVGAGGTGNSLMVSNGGKLFSQGTWVGGTGVTHSGNQLVISDGGRASCGNVALNFAFGGGTNCQILVDGTNSILECASLNVGRLSSVNRVIVSNGAALFNSGASIIGQNNGNNNSLLVTGVGSIWTNGGMQIGDSSVGGGTNNSLVISNGGTFIGSLNIGSLGSNNWVRVTGAGSLCQGAIFVGTGSGINSRLLVDNGGHVIVDNVNLTIGNGRTISVFDSGSALTIANDLDLTGPNGSIVISNGGAMNVSGFGYISSGTNSVIVSGSGSVWSNNADLLFGYYGTLNHFVISNGAQVLCESNAYVGYYGSTNSAVVTGNGSEWKIGNALSIGFGPAFGNTLVISNDASVSANLVSAVGGSIGIFGGSLCVTNPLGNSLLFVGGTLVFDGSTITADQLNTSGSNFAFNRGLLNSRGTSVGAGEFAVGNGTTSGNFHLLGGTHSFNDGLRIRVNSLLSGCGTVNGSVVVDAGAIVRSDCTNLMFTGNVTNNGTMLADGAVLESSGTLVNNGTIYLFNGGTTNFHGTFINNGSIVNVGAPTISSISRVGTDIAIKLTSVPGLTYQLQSASSLASPIWSDTSTAQNGTGGVLTFTDPGAAINASPRFYRVRVQ
jgi:fibronectin-binding autotransporter adhesin